jgi:Domain of unknown function (DUF1772)
MLGILALLVASLFAGAAIYVSVAEHPARMQLDPDAALKQWKPAYAKGAVMQASLALIGFALGAAQCFIDGLRTGQFFLQPDWWFLVGALILVANWPYTLVVIMPANNKLNAQASADESTMKLLHRWGALHLWRGVLGAASVLVFAGACWITAGYQAF